MSENSKLLVRAAKMLDLPSDAFASLAHIEICGTNQVFIENHKGILEYTDSDIALNLGAHILKIEGHNLEVSSMDELGLRLSGDVTLLRFDPV